MKRFEFVHVVESLGGGVLSAIVTLINEQSKMGAKSELIYLERSMTPPQSHLASLLPDNCVLRPIGKSSAIGLLKMAFVLLHDRKFLHQNRVYHLHSSWAGLVGKLILGRTRKINLHYTPHGFSFIRKDINGLTKYLFKIIESVTNRFSLANIICTSNHELDLAIRNGAHSTTLLRNCVDTRALELVRNRVNLKGRKKALIGTVGRIAPQKNPARFLSLSENLMDENDFVWIGDGDRELLRGAMGNKIAISGWLKHADAIQEMANLDIMVLLSDWESFPVCVLEAQSMGIPCILWNFETAKELVHDGIDGFIVDNICDLAKKIELLLQSPNLYSKIGQNAVETATQFYSLEAYRKSIPQAYQL